MERTLVVLVVMTLMEEVISCEYPLLNAVVIGGMVLLMVGIWSDPFTAAADAGAERAGPETGGHGHGWRSAGGLGHASVASSARSSTAERGRPAPDGRERPPSV